MSLWLPDRAVKLPPWEHAYRPLCEAVHRFNRLFRVELCVEQGVIYFLVDHGKEEVSVQNPYPVTTQDNIVGSEQMMQPRQQRNHESGLGARMRKRRKDLGWTQTELAENVGTSQAVIQKIENGKSLRPRILEELARSLDVKPAWLMFGVEEAGELSDDAIELARAWARLKEPHRSAMREAILRIGRGG